MLEHLKEAVLRKGAKAQTILDDEVFQEAVKSVRQQYLDAFEGSKVTESEVREMSYMAIRLLKEIEGRLQTYVSEALFEQKKP